MHLSEAPSEGPKVVLGVLWYVFVVQVLTLCRNLGAGSVQIRCCPETPRLIQQGQMNTRMKPLFSRVQGLGLRVKGSRCRGYASGCRAEVLIVMVWGPEIRIRV